ncbi:MAG: hypothetical protein ACFB21_00350 [Opitutales bacterium]
MADTVKVVKVADGGFWLMLVGTLVMVAVGAWWWQREQAQLDAAEQRINELAGELAAAREEKQRLLARTALTLIHVSENAITLQVATADGSVREIATPFSPENEVFVDYVVHQGRVLIRRVFDEHTPPNQAVSVDPNLVAVDWGSLGDSSHGRAIYRRLSPGRWIISISGAGALGLEPVSSDALPSLKPAPNLSPKADGRG